MLNQTNLFLQTMLFVVRNINDGEEVVSTTPESPPDDQNVKLKLFQVAPNGQRRSCDWFRARHVITFLLCSCFPMIAVDPMLRALRVFQYPLPLDRRKQTNQQPS
uniref:Uncharacterized protein n=1 Tax=Timema tahoe TaxID=61484 RepID=A0A7R9ISQ7_9NEOP|nr:unnamed protein product [Timema tahoe]